MAAMSMSMNQDNSEFSYVQPYSTNSGKSDSFMDKMKMMMMEMKMKDMMRSNYQNDNEQLFNEFFKSMGSSDRIDNMTCVLKETNTLDASNNLDIQAMKRDAQQYTMPSPWFGQKYEEILDTCYEMATNLPAEMADNSVVSGSFGTVKLGEIKMFTKCCEKAETKLCMNQDMKT